MTTLASESWTGTNGAAWPAQWTTDGGTATIQSNAGQLVCAASTAESALASVSTSTFEITGTVVLGTSNAAAGISVGTRAGDFFMSSGYTLDISNTAQTVAIYTADPADTSTQRTSVAFTLTTATTYSFRFRRSGGVIYGRVWTGTEPGTWTVQWTDTLSYGAGSPQLSAYGGGSTATVTFDNLLVTDGANTAALAGGGVLTAAGAAKPAGTAALTGGGTLTDAGIPKPAGTAGLTGAGPLTGSGSPRPAGTAAPSGSGVLTASGASTGASTAAFTGGGVLTATFTGGDSFTATAAFTGGGSLSGTGQGYGYRFVGPSFLDYRPFQIYPPTRLVFAIPYGETVWWDSTGTWQQQYAPTLDQLAGATAVYGGGRKWPLTDAQRADLIAAGYGANISLEQLT